MIELHSLSALDYARLAAGTITIIPHPLQMHKDGGAYHPDLLRLFESAISHAYEQGLEAAAKEAEAGEDTYKEIRRACDEKLAAVTADLEHAQKRWEAELSTSAGWQHRAERVIKERDALGRQVADLQTEIAAIKSSETVAWLMEGNYGKFVSRQNAIADYRELDKDSIVTEIIRRPK